MRIARRSKLERLIDTLKVIASDNPVRQTHIMYRANLTWNELKEDLEWLKNLELIERATMREGVVYKITRAGSDILSHFEMVESALKTTRRICL